MLYPQKIALAIAALTLSFNAQANCGGAFCTINTDAGVQGTFTKPGVRLDIRADILIWMSCVMVPIKPARRARWTSTMSCAPSTAMC